MDLPRPKATLESVNEDVFHEICQATLNTTGQDEKGKTIKGHEFLKALSSTNHDMRERLAPIVFKSIYISVRSWRTTLEALRLVESCHSVRQYMRRLHLNVYDFAPGSLIPQAFAKLLKAVETLEKLSINIATESETKTFSRVVQEANIKLPFLRTLILGPGFDWMIELCPNLTWLSTHEDWPKKGTRPRQRSFDLVRLAGTAEHLHTLEITEYWNAELIESIAVHVPHLKSLGILGLLQYFKLTDLLPALSKLRILRTLLLPMASELGIGFDPPDCGNAYMGPDGAEVARRVEREGQQAELQASFMVFNACPQLQVLWIRDKRMLRPTPETMIQLSRTEFVVNEFILELMS